MQLKISLLFISLLVINALHAYRYTLHNGTPEAFDIEIFLTLCAEGPLKFHVSPQRTAVLETTHWYSHGCLLDAIRLVQNGTVVFRKFYNGLLGTHQFTINYDNSAHAAYPYTITMDN